MTSSEPALPPFPRLPSDGPSSARSESSNGGGGLTPRDRSGSKVDLFRLAKESTEKLLRHFTAEEANIMSGFHDEAEKFLAKSTGWIGHNFVFQIKLTLRNPLPSVLKGVLLPPALEVMDACTAILSQTKSGSADSNGPVLVPSPRSHSGKPDSGELPMTERLPSGNPDNVPTLPREISGSSAGRTISLPDILDAILRFLVVRQNNDARSLAQTALTWYPKELRLHKMHVYVVIRDRSVNWRRIRLEECLNAVDSLKPAEMDAEMHALRGALLEALWAVDKTNIPFADQALKAFEKSFVMCNDVHEPVLAGIGYGLARAALLSAQLYQLESTSARGNRKVAEIWKTQATERLRKLHDALLFWQKKKPSELYPQFFYYLSFARFGLAMYQEGIAAAEDYGKASQDQYRLFRKASLERKHSSSQHDLQQIKNSYPPTPTNEDGKGAAPALPVFSAGTGAAAVEMTEENPPDRMDPETTDDVTESENFNSIVRIIVFSGLSIPSSGLKISEWHPVWREISSMFHQPPLDVHVNREILATALRGRVGLSLSGGGLRAAFIHLGLLARMAECDMLRSISSISCVSGGSLVGAHLYMLIKELMEEKPDKEITKEDYIELVKRLILEFVAATRRDHYTNTLVNPLHNLRVTFGRTERIRLFADGFHRTLFSNPRWNPDGARIKMRDLRIVPKDWPQNAYFQPRLHNWRRGSKAPALYLNCTNLNTGHLWRFCVTYMGEKADMVEGDVGIDTNSILESVEYDECRLPQHRDIPLAECVAVSMLLPGFLGMPYKLDDLYPGFKLRLVDGSVFENAGVQSLYHAQTDYLIVNEMGMPLEDLPDMRQSSLSTVGRLVDIAINNTFERVYRELKHSAQNHGVADVCFVHLRQPDLLSQQQKETLNLYRRVQAVTKQDRVKDIAAKTIARREIKERLKTLAKKVSESSEAKNGAGTGDKGETPSQKQSRLRKAREATGENKPRLHLGHFFRSQIAAVRTNLDHFSEVEAASLMSTGYMLAKDALRHSSERCVIGLEDPDTSPMIGRMPSEERKGFTSQAIANLALAGCSVGEWSFFEVTSPQLRDWWFSPVLDLLQKANHVEIEPPRKHGDRPSFDPEKVASEMRSTLKVQQQTDNPALVELYKHLAVSDGQIALFRMLRASKMSMFWFGLTILAILAGIGYGVGTDFADFLSHHGFDDKSCICVYETALYYLVIILVFYFLFVSPGWLADILWSAVFLPTYALLNNYIFDPYNNQRGSLARLVSLHETYKARKRAEKDHINAVDQHE